jgi:hypothetical protein
LTIVHPIKIIVFPLNQVSAVTDHVGMQASGATTGDLDDDEGGGLVGQLIWFNMLDNLINWDFYAFSKFLYFDFWANWQNRGFNLAHILQTEPSQFSEVPLHIQ